MKLGAKDLFGLLKKSAKDFGEDECPRQAAALAYYTIFAMPPLLILILTLVGAFVSREQVQQALSGQFGHMLGADGARTVEGMISQAKQPGGGLLPSLLGVAALVLGATGAFLNLQAALNRAWEVKPDPRAGGIKNFIFKRVLSLGMVLGVAFLLLVSLALSTALTAVGGAVGSVIPGASGFLLGVLQTLLSLVVIALLFAAIFKVLPDAEIAWKDVWIGGIFTAVLFELGKWAIGIYLGHSNPGKAYGAAGSMAVVLVWIYYTSMIVLFGAEFTQTWAVERGGGIRPEEGAVRVEEGTVKTVPRAAEAAPAGKTPRERAQAAEHDSRPATGEGGVGRREHVGGSGVWPASAEDAPRGAPARAPGQLAAQPRPPADEPDERDG